MQLYAALPLLQTVTANQEKMKIYLYSNNENFGEIILNSGSKHTKEFRGMLLAKEGYFENRFVIRKYFTDLKYRPPKGLFWKTINKFDKRSQKLIEDFQKLNLRIKSSENLLTDKSSEIIIQDSIQRTGKGNWFIQIDVLKMKIPVNFPEFDLFQIEWLYPSIIKGTIGIKKEGKLIMEY